MTTERKILMNDANDAVGVVTVGFVAKKVGASLGTPSTR